MNTTNKFKVGDRVTRPDDVMDKHSKLRHGMVTEVYQDTMSMYRRYNELYKVRWDDTGVEHVGYLPHGLEHEVKS